jgi:superfamily II DNA/RNA helicase
MSEEKQQRVLKGSPEVVVGTPGRLWHLIEQVCIIFLQDIKYHNIINIVILYRYIIQLLL